MVKLKLFLYTSYGNKGEQSYSYTCYVGSGRQIKWYNIYKQKQPLYRPLALRILGG